MRDPLADLGGFAEGSAQRARLLGVQLRRPVKLLGPQGASAQRPLGGEGLHEGAGVGCCGQDESLRRLSGESAKGRQKTGFARQSAGRQGRRARADKKKAIWAKRAASSRNGGI